MHAAALFYFREVTRVGSIRKAAISLNVAASALNRQILKLEDELGTPLFDRLPGGMRLTVAGELLLRHVTSTLHDFDRLRADIDDLREARSGHVSVAALDSLLVDFLPRALVRFRADFPAVSYSALALQPADIPQAVAAGDADMGFTFVTAQIPPTVRFLAEVAAPIGVVMRPDHPLANRLQIEFEETRPFNIFTQPGPLPRAAEADPDYIAFRASIAPKVLSNSIQMLKLCVMLNMGIAFFTRLGFLHEIEHGDLVWRPFTSPGVNQLRIGLLTPAARQMSPPAAQLAKRLAADLDRFASV
ncbi:transcriptional regulator [Alsobacter metallidurans]|uniref:Transcriptional regulator n=1 Tax=Alsobacter metallidurans TaxID=340221 RepID=A0A917I7Y0_9HYPH|nr:LysR family transcriptional regulator [Alsobacter metallidurans]GGH19596.1 transcriptional regulator [Alsobacter metallidurans]